jgi:NAD(P)-dependent dehydrogenase (short-subunit alcohol dehydrogenase family)
MRNVDAGMKNLHELTGADLDDDRLTPVPLDLDSEESITVAAEHVLSLVGAPDAVVHNAGIAAVGCAEETSPEVLHQVFSTNFFGPALLTNHLLPSMRRAGRGRIVVVSSLGGLRGMPATSAYSAAKSALERWAESLAYEVGPFGIGVSIVVAGSHRTAILTSDGPIDCTDREGPYAGLYEALLGVQEQFVERAAPPERFAATLAEALTSTRPFSRHIAGADARAMVLINKLPEGVVQSIVRRVVHLPKPVPARNR